MTVVNIQSKISGWDVQRKPSEGEIRTALAVARFLVFPFKLLKSIGIFRSILFVDIAMKLKIFDFTKNFSKYSEFEQMDSLSEIMFMRESLEALINDLKELENKSIKFPLRKSITNKLNNLYKYLTKIEVKYKPLVYPDAPDSDSEEFKMMLKKEYSEFDLEY